MLPDQLGDQEEFKKKQEKLFEQQKKFRSLESDKRMFAEETINLIKKQQLAIDKLRKENESLKEFIAKLNTETESKKGMSAKQIKEMIIEINQAIEEERENQKNIDMHISNFQKKILEKKKNTKGANTAAQSKNNLQKQIQTLEDKLDQTNQKYNETISINKNLKNEIDSLRKERVIFDNIYRKLEGELHEKRKKMADIIQKANGAYEDRDKANLQITTMKLQAKKEAVEFQKEIKQMSHLIEKIKLSSYAKKTQKQETFSPGFSTYNQQQFLPDAKITRPTKKGSQQLQKIQKFREDFAKIEAATQIDNFQRLLSIFSSNQEMNFQMFKFVNLQSTEIEELQFEVGAVRSEVEQASEQSSDSGKERCLREMEEQLRVQAGCLKRADTEYRAAQKEAKVLNALIERIFDTIECDRDVAKEVGGSKHISETNMLVFLAMVEHKAAQIVATYKALSNEHMFAATTDKPAHPNPGLLTFEDFQDNQEHDKMLNVQELRKIASNFVSKQFTQKFKKKEIRPKKK